MPTEAGSGIPVTYVPARNTVFLSFALGLAEVMAADDIFIGVNAVDYSGYPDCRPEFIQAFEQMANLATKAGATKIETVAEAGDPVDVLVALIEGRKVDLCIVGNRGLNSLAGRLLGSVPANISHRAACDVLIVHTTGGGRS